mgnify:CR=1 FL=1
MTDTAQQLEKEHHFQIYKRYPITLVKGNGTWVTDSEGNNYLDVMAGIAVNSLGHCHPAMVEAIQEQAEKLIHVSNLVYNEPQGQLAELLTEVSGMDRVFFCNSGTEAMEAAVKIARKYGKNKEKTGSIVSMDNSFHGRTMGALALGREKYSKNFTPMLTGFERIEMNDFEALRSSVDEHTPAVVVEPIQGEGGIYPVDPSFLEEVRKVCDQHGALLIVDEIQCGIGRTGSMFAYQKFEVEPDVVATAKGLGGGFPIGAVLAKEHAASVLEPGDHGTTFGGNPLACAASMAVVETISEGELDNEAGKKGDYLLDMLDQATEDIDAVEEVRGTGLMIGVQLKFDGAEVIKAMLKRGVLANCANKTVIRIVPPLTINYHELNTLTEVLIESIQEVANQ